MFVSLLKLVLALIFCFTALLSCSSSSSSSEFPDSTASNYFKVSSQVTIEVYYEPSATPFTGSTIHGLVYWSILSDNLNAIFSYRTHPPTVTVPTTLSDMTQIPAQNKSTWTIDDVMTLHRSYRSALPTASHARFYVYFLQGYSSDGTSVIGFSIGGTPVVAVFKQVISASGGPAVQKFVEQSTLVHEIGHALGFVNNGVPMAVNHQDTAHGAHTTDSNCVMYWLNEGASDLASFVQNYVNTETTVMWGPEVKADAQNFSD